MTEKYRFFDSTTGDTREYNADQFGEYFRTLINTGLVKGALNDLEVTADGLTMNSTIDTGNVFIDGYWYENDESLALEHDVETVGNDRIDRVVIRLDKTVTNRYVRAFIVKGTAGVTPTAPVLTRTSNIYELSLAQVYITGGQSFIATLDVTDERGDVTLCPYADSNILPSFDSQDLVDLTNDFDTHVLLSSSETVKGHVELATAAETTTGTDNTRAVHPAGLKVELDKKATTATYTTTLNTTWTGSSAPFSKTQSVTGILSTDNPIVDLTMSGTFATDEARSEAWGKIYRITTAADSITLYATEAPTVELPIQLKVVR